MSIVLAPAQLYVSFGTGGGSPAFLGANYIIKNLWVDAQGNYQRVLIGYGKNLPASFQLTWVLAREEVISDADLEESLDYAVAAGFNPKAALFLRSPCSDAQRVILNQN